MCLSLLPALWENTSLRVMDLPEENPREKENLEKYTS